VIDAIIKTILRWAILVILAAGGLYWLLGSWRAA
jgi:FlaG/FlaF family flagellin (archaellin)